MTHLKQTVPLLPRRLLFGNPERTDVLISPDGTKMSYIAPVEGILNLWVAPVDDMDAARPVTHDRDRGILFFSDAYQWAFTGRHLLYEQDTNGDENYHVFAVDITSGKVRDLTPLEGVRAFVVKLSPQHPSQAVIAINDRDARYHDLYLVDIQTGERELLLENPSFLLFPARQRFHHPIRSAANT